MSRIWVVGEPHHPSIAKWGAEVVSVPAVYLDVAPTRPERVNRRLSKFAGIKQAMSNAVHFAALGDLIIQNDVEITADPFAAPKVPHHIRTLIPSYRINHVHPLAFIIYDSDTRDEVLDRWNGGRDQSCVAWGDLWFVDDYEAAVHRGQP